MELKPSAVLVVDGGVDLPEGFAVRHGLFLIPLMLRFGNQELRSGVDISPAEFYARLRAGGDEHPSTSQPSVGDYANIYREAGKAGLPILSIHLSAGLSGSCASARIARDMVPELDIRIIDSGTLTAAMAMQVMVAADQAAAGTPVDEIIRNMKAVSEKTDLFFTIDTLEYLRRGGRIGKVAGYVGSLLGIRPIITVDKSTGTYVPVSRARSFRQAINAVVDTMVERLGEGTDVTCLIVQGDVAPEAQRLVEMLNARFKVHWLEVVRCNPSLGVHVGPDAIGIGFYAGKLPAPSLVAPVAV